MPRRRGRVWAIVLALLLLTACVWSVTVGAVRTPPATVWEAVFGTDNASTAHEVVRSLRLPRAVVGAMVGAALAMAGALMQGLTRNPLASPSLMGLNAGASLALVVLMAVYPGLGHTPLIVAGFVGASVGALLVFGVGALSPAGLTPVRLALAGAAVSGLLGAFTTGLVLLYGIAQGLLFYSVGGVQNASWRQALLFAPWWLAGTVLATVIAPRLTVLALGDDVAVGLGQRLRATRAIGTLAVLALAGGAVAVAGNVAFVGLVAPHLARYFVGVDYRKVVPIAGLLGALLVVVADGVGRLIRPPFETPVGLLTAVIGVPFLLYYARRVGHSA